MRSFSVFLCGKTLFLSLCNILNGLANYMNYARNIYSYGHNIYSYGVKQVILHPKTYYSDFLLFWFAIFQEFFCNNL